MIFSKSLEVRVGFFIGVGILAFVIVVLSLGGDRSIFNSYYQLNVKFDTVDGLATGSVIQLAGLPVGNVSEIQFQEDENQLLVVLSINSKFKGKIRKGSVALLKTQGALGDKYVFIKQGPVDAPALKEGDFIETEKSKDLFDTLTSSGHKVERIFDVVEEIHRFFAGLNHNENNIKLMENLVRASEHMSLSAEQVNSLLKDIRGPENESSRIAQSLLHLSNVLKKIDDGRGTLGGLVNDPTVHNRLKDILGGSKRETYIRGLLKKTIKESRK